MSKVKYYYDPETLSYRPIGVTNKNRISNFVLFIVSSFLLFLNRLPEYPKSQIDDIEKEPAYKRHGIDLEEVSHSSENNESRLTLNLDENDDIQLRTNNSFLHDNVD